MPYSEKQRGAACAAYHAKKTGDASKLKGTSKQMYSSMSKAKLREWCKGPLDKPQVSAG